MGDICLRYIIKKLVIMKTDTELLNEIAQRSNLLRQLTEVEKHELRRTLLDMHNDIIKVCDKYGLIVMLGGGSCLGAVRHKGFIPWDDDLDLMMPRNDYEKLICLFENGQIGNKYCFEYPNKHKDVKNTFLKIYLKDTVFKEIFDDNELFPTSVFLDIFPIDYAPENNIIRRCKAFLSDGLQFICTCTLYSQYPSVNLKAFYGYDKSAKRRYDLRILIGKIFSVFSHRRWVNWFDELNKTSKPSKMMTIPTGRKHYLLETLPSSVFIPTKECTFEGVKSFVPNEYHTYLSNLYGNYMQVPPEDKRERHFIVDIKL